MNILVATDEKYFKHIQSMIFSVYKNTDEEIRVYFINQNVSYKKLKRLKQELHNKYNIKFDIINIEEEVFENFPTGFHFSVEMYFRLLAQYILPLEMDRILWLDVDIICLKNIKDFYYQEFEDKSLIVCPDKMSYSEKIQQYQERLGIHKKTIYFNSGVLLMNLEKLRKKYTKEQIIDISKQMQEVLTFPDQDILNVLYENDVKIVSNYYNYQLNGRNYLEKKDAEKIYFLHYNGQEKPWIYKCINEVSKYYWQNEKEQGHYMKYNIIHLKYYVYRVIKKIYFKIRRYK